MAKDEFALLDEIVKKISDETPDPVDVENFNFGNIVQEMEKGFTELGFRNSDKKIAGATDNILLIRGDHVTDFVLTTPAIREIRRAFPFARITLLVSPKVRSLAESCPYINEVIDTKDLKFNKDNPIETLKNVAEFAKKNLWKNRYSLALDFKVMAEWTNHLLMYMSGARERVGYRVDAREVYRDMLLPEENHVSYQLLTHPAIFEKDVFRDVERNLYLLKFYGIKVHSSYEELWYNATDLFKAQKLLEGFAEGKIKIAVGISADKGEKRYLASNYLTALEKIIDSGAAIVIFGDAAVKEDAKFLQESLPEESVINLVAVGGSMPFKVAVMSQLDMYIGNFNAFFDIAQACHLPVIGISCEAKDRSPKFNGVSQFHRLFPYQVESIVLQPDHPLGDCIDISKRLRTSSCNHNGEPHCITQIKPDQVIKAYNKMADYLDKVKKIRTSPIMYNFTNPVWNMQSYSYLRKPKVDEPSNEVKS